MGIEKIKEIIDSMFGVREDERKSSRPTLPPSFHTAPRHSALDAESRVLKKRENIYVKQ